MCARRSFDLGASAPRLILRGIATGLRLTNTRTHRRQVEAVIARRFPGRLRIIDARSLFPQSLGSRFTFAVTDDVDAVVHLRVDETLEDLDAALDEAVADALARAAELRCLLSVFAGHGFPVVALEQLTPAVVVRLTDDTVAATLTELGAAVRAWTSEHTSDGHPTGLGAAVQVTILPTPPSVRRGTADLPTPLRLARAGLAVDVPKHVASYPLVDGVAEGTPSTLYVSRDYAVRAAFEERVLTQSKAWLRGARPGAVALRCHGLWPLVPGRVAETTGHVLVANRRPPTGRLARPDHAMAVTVDLDGTFTAPPALILDVRDDRGVVTLPPDPDA